MKALGARGVRVDLVLGLLVIFVLIVIEIAAQLTTRPNFEFVKGASVYTGALFNSNLGRSLLCAAVSYWYSGRLEWSMTIRAL